MYLYRPSSKVNGNPGAGAILALILLACGPSSASSSATVDLDAARKFFVEGEKAFEGKRFADSAHAYVAAIDTGIQYPDIAYSAAEAYSRADDPKSAIKYLSMAIDLGFHGDLRADADLQPLHAQPLWTELVQRHERREKAYRAAHANPDNVGISTSDVVNFWHAYDLALPRPAAEWQGIFRQEYFNKRSPEQVRCAYHGDVFDLKTEFRSVGRKGWPVTGRDVMQSARSVVVGILVTAALCGALPLRAQNSTAGGHVETEVLAAQAERDKAFVAGDAKTVENFMADEFLQTDVKGKVQDKAAWIKEYLLPIAAGIKAGDFRWDVYKRTEVQVRVFGDVAVVIGALELHGWSSSGKNNERPSRFLRFTRVWVKRGNGWKLAMVHNEYFTPRPLRR